MDRLRRADPPLFPARVQLEQADKVASGAIPAWNANPEEPLGDEDEYEDVLVSVLMLMLKILQPSHQPANRILQHRILQRKKLCWVGDLSRVSGIDAPAAPVTSSTTNDSGKFSRSNSFQHHRSVGTPTRSTAARCVNR